MDPEHTPIDIPDSQHNFLCPDDAPVIPTNPEGLPSSGESSSTKQTAAGMAVRGERVAQQKLYEAEAEVEARFLGKRNVRIFLF